MNRSSELIALAAAAMDDGRDPFHEAFLVVPGRARSWSFLVEHGVSLNEVYEMGEALALAARLLLVLKTPPHRATFAVLLAEAVV